MATGAVLIRFKVRLPWHNKRRVVGFCSCCCCCPKLPDFFLFPPLFFLSKILWKKRINSWLHSWNILNRTHWPEWRISSMTQDRTARPLASSSSKDDVLGAGLDGRAGERWVLLVRPSSLYWVSVLTITMLLTAWIGPWPASFSLAKLLMSLK